MRLDPKALKARPARPSRDPLSYFAQVPGPITLRDPRADDDGVVADIDVLAQSPGAGSAPAGRARTPPRRRRSAAEAARVRSVGQRRDLRGERFPTLLCYRQACISQRETPSRPTGHGPSRGAILLVGHVCVLAVTPWGLLTAGLSAVRVSACADSPFPPLWTTREASYGAFAALHAEIADHRSGTGPWVPSGKRTGPGRRRSPAGRAAEVPGRRTAPLPHHGPVVDAVRDRPKNNPREAVQFSPRRLDRPSRLSARNSRSSW